MAFRRLVCSFFVNIHWCFLCFNFLFLDRSKQEQVKLMRLSPLHCAISDQWGHGKVEKSVRRTPLQKRIVILVCLWLAFNVNGCLQPRTPPKWTTL